MQDITGLFEKRKEDELDVITLDCLPDVKFTIRIPGPKDIEELREKCTGKKNRFQTLRFRRAIAKRVIKNWEGLTCKKALSIMPVLKAGNEYKDDIEIGFSHAMIDLLIDNSEDFGRDLALTFISSEETSEAMREEKEDAEIEEASLKNSPGSAAKSSADRDTAE